jgi:leucyl aminopeptidase
MEEFEKKKTYHEKLEALRGVGHKLCSVVNGHKYDSIQLQSVDELTNELLAVTEGCALSNYQFLKYKSDKKEKHTLKNISIFSKKVSKKELELLSISTEAVFKARDLVNEPQSYLDAVTFADEMKAMGKKAGFKVEVLNKKQIEALKMGGLLAVNKGSQIPPTFTIMEWKPKKAKNKQPLVLVGKGVVYDTGGLSLKPTPNSMDTMKCDMAGGAAVAATLFAVAKAELPYHVIALVPATDNRPGEDAYTPGDVVKMYDGQTVEVLNTDAEGRMLLADALAYAKKYKPEMVLDFATLTGAAAAAIGPFGIVCMGTADEKQKAILKESGNAVYERLVEFPFWDEYAKLIKSDLADMKNIGGPVGGAITAGKFLEKYVDYPWMHFDIAGPAYLSSTDSYRGKNGTGVAVRFLFDYIKNLSK